VTFSPVKALIFLSVALVAAKARYWTLFLDSHGLTPSEIGLLMGIGSLAQLFATPIWGLLSDLTGRPTMMLGVGLAGHVICLQAFLFSGIFSLPVVCYGIYAIATGFEGSVSLVETVSIANAKRTGESYGGQRWLASLGFGVGGLLSGCLLESYGFSMLFAWTISVGLLTISAAIASGYAVGSPAVSNGASKKEEGEEEERGLAKLWLLLRTIKRAARDGAFFNLLVNATMFGTLVNMVDSMMVLHLQQAFNISKSYVGVLGLIGTISEIPVFIAVGQTMKRRGRETTMLFGNISFGIRMGLLAYIATRYEGTNTEFSNEDGDDEKIDTYLISDKIMLLIALAAAQSLHGFSLVPYWTGAVEASYALAPANLKSAYLGLLSMAFFTMGAGAIGSIVYGAIYDAYGGAAMYTTGILVSFVSAVHLKLCCQGVSKGTTAKHELKVKSVSLPPCSP